MQTHRARVEDYLTTIYRLEEAYGVAKITDISRELEVSPATVSKVVKRLERSGYIVRERYHYVALTPLGREVAEGIIRKHRIAELFLSRVLGFSDYESHYYAHHLEHLPDVVIDRIHELVGRLEYCPHGNPLPGSPRHEDEKLVRLSKVSVGEVCTIKRLVGELREILDYAGKELIKVGSVLRVVSVKPETVVVELEDSRLKEIPTRLANLIVVSCKT